MEQPLQLLLQSAFSVQLLQLFKSACKVIIKRSNTRGAAVGSLVSCVPSYRLRDLLGV